jgi:hypothetical protein
MPAVAFVTPPNSESGHPAYSTVSRYQDFVRRLVGKVQANRSLWAETAPTIIVVATTGLSPR